MSNPGDEQSPSIGLRPARCQWIVLMACALVVRSGFLLLADQNLQADPDGYRRLAENLVAEGTLGDRVPGVDHDSAGTWQATPKFLPTAYRPPLYPGLLAALVKSPLEFRLGVALLHLATGLLTVWLTVKIGVQLGLRRASLLAGVLVACDPILLQQSSLVMTETLATLLAVMAIGCLIRCLEGDQAQSPAHPWARFALAGGVLGLAALCRPTFLVMIPLAGCWLWFQLPKSAGRRNAAVAYLITALLVLAPWIVRNALVFGQPIVATTHGGYTFHLANNPGFYNFLRTGRWGTVWNSTDNFRLHAGSDLSLNMTDYPELRLTELAANTIRDGIALPIEAQQQELVLDQLHYADAWAAIRDEPGMFAYSILVRLGRLWQPLPHRVATSDSLRPSDQTSESVSRTATESLRSWFARYLVALWYLGVYVLAAMGLWSLGWKLLRSPWCWGMLLVASFMALHALYWTDMRMRAPLVPVVCWCAATGWNCYHSARSARKA